MKKFTVSTLLLNFLVVLTPLRSFSFQQRERSTHSHTKNQQKQDTLLSETNRRQFLHQIILFTPIPATLAANYGINRQPANAAFLPTATKATTTVARDKFGSEMYSKQYIASKPARDRSLVFGLKDEPTYLIVNDDKTLEKFALNAECSHLGCVVPWNSFEQKFVCPCHGSQYDSMGNVLRGPAPYALALAHVDVDEENGGKIILSPWTETDFRTNEPPWWT